MDHTRRRVLESVVLATATLAGCLGDGGSNDAPTATDPDDESNATDDESDETDDGADATVVVAPGGTHSFDPANLEVDVGTTVTFEWEGDGHNVSVTNQPDGGGWDGESTVSSVGHTHTHTFDVEGVYEYQCDPHASAGMTGSITVGEPADGADDGGNGTDDDGDDNDGDANDGDGGGDDSYGY